MTEVLGVIQSVSHQELVRRIKTCQLHRVPEVRVDVLVQQGANIERTGASHPEEVHEAAQGPPRVDNVLHEKNVLPLQFGFRIVHQPDVAARLHLVAVAGGDEKIDLKRPGDGSDEIAQEDEASLEQSKDEEVTLRVHARDLAAELGNPFGDLVRAIDDATNRTPI